MNVVYLAGGFPSDDNPSHGVFNLRAAIAISKFVKLTVIHYRAYKPTRRLHRIHYEDGFSKHIVCIPFIPFMEEKMYWLNNTIFKIFTRLYIGKILNNADVVHASDGNLSVFASQLKNKYNFKLLAQFIGGDINQDMPSQKDRLSQINWFDKLDAITCNSDSIKKSVEHIFGSHRNLHKVYRGVDVNKFYQMVNDDEQIIFYYLGGMPNYRTFKHGRNTKGGRTLMDAWKGLDKSDMLQESKLMFAGPDSTIDEVVNWRNSLQYPEKVTLVGKIHPDDINEFHQKGNVNIIPSLEEGLPNVAMEAGSTSNMVIATNVGGIPEVINHKTNGVLIEPDDAKALSKEIANVIEQSDVIVRYGLALRREIVANFDSVNFGKKYFKIYQSIA